MKTIGKYYNHDRRHFEFVRSTQEFAPITEYKTSVIGDKLVAVCSILGLIILLFI